MEALEKLSTSSPLSSPKAAKKAFQESIEQQKVDIQKLEEKAEAALSAAVDGKEIEIPNGTG